MNENAFRIVNIFSYVTLMRKTPLPVNDNNKYAPLTNLDLIQ